MYTLLIIFIIYCTNNNILNHTFIMIYNFIIAVNSSGVTIEWNDGQKATGFWAGTAGAPL